MRGKNLSSACDVLDCAEDATRVDESEEKIYLAHVMSWIVQQTQLGEMRVRKELSSACDVLDCAADATRVDESEERIYLAHVMSWIAQHTLTMT